MPRLENEANPACLVSIDIDTPTNLKQGSSFSTSKIDLLDACRGGSMTDGMGATFRHLKAYAYAHISEHGLHGQEHTHPHRKRKKSEEEARATARQ